MRQTTPYEWREGALRVQRTPKGGLAYYFGMDLIAFVSYGGDVRLRDNRPFVTHGVSEKLVLWADGFERVSPSRLMSEVRAEAAGFHQIQLLSRREMGEAYGHLLVSWADSFAAGNCYRGSVTWLREHFGNSSAAPLADIVANTLDPRALDACAWAASVWETMRIIGWPVDLTPETIRGTG